MLKLFGFVGNKISNVIRNANNDGPPDLDELKFYFQQIQII